MQIDLAAVNADYFFKRPCVVAGAPCVLIEPHAVGVAKWDRHNLHLRSSIWDMEGNPVSLGYKKFMNFDEDRDKDGVLIPDKIPYPKPKDLNGAEILEKLDGSLLIVSRFKGQTIVRTRGTVDAEMTLSNGHELPALRSKYNLDLLSHEFPEYSWLIEWFSPANKIVLDYGPESKLWLVGAVRHDDYSLMSQDGLDRIAKVYGLGRPARYQFGSIDELRAAVEALEGKEGVCVYYNGGQNILKLKSARYLALHYYKGDVSTFDKVVDIWLSIGRPGYQAFYDFLAQKYDWEIAVYARPHLSKICDAAEKVEDVRRGMENFINNQCAGLSRKEQAEKVFAAYGNTNRAAMVFHLIDGKGLTDADVKRLVLQLMG